MGAKEKLQLEANMLQRSSLIVFAALGTLGLSALGLTGAVAHPDDQHGLDEGHLAGTGEFGKIDLVDVVGLTNTPDLIADVSVSPDGNTAYLANWGEPDCAGPETGGQTSPDAGVSISWTSRALIKAPQERNRSR